MNRFPKIATPAVVALALAMSAGAAFAAPMVKMAEPGSGMAINDFKSQLSVFNPLEVTDLVSAKNITEIKYDSAWTGKDSIKAVNLLTTDAPAISQLREALQANPAAVKLLADNHIVLNDVVDIVSDGAGNVTLYVS